MSERQDKFESVGEDVYTFMVRGHVDPEQTLAEFKATHKYLEFYGYTEWRIEHLWWHATPAPKDSDFRCLYSESKPNVPGAFPVTLIIEA